MPSTDVQTSNRVCGQGNTQENAAGTTRCARDNSVPAFDDHIDISMNPTVRRAPPRCTSA